MKDSDRRGGGGGRTEEDECSLGGDEVSWPNNNVTVIHVWDMHCCVSCSFS